MRRSGRLLWVGWISRCALLDAVEERRGVRCRDVGGEGGGDDGGGSCGIGDWCGGGGGGGDAAGGSGKHSSNVCAARTLGSLGLTDYEQRLSEFTATMMLNLPSSPECFRYALGKYYFRLAGPLQALHKLLQPAPKTGTEALGLIDLLHSVCFGSTVGGTASTARTPPGSKLALSRGKI